MTGDYTRLVASRQTRMPFTHAGRTAYRASRAGSHYTGAVALWHVETVVRMTARASAAVFAGALVCFALANPNSPAKLLPAVRLMAAFLLVHTIHFAAVLWLAWWTAGHNIEERGGWPLMLAVATVFYGAAFTILRRWNQLRSGRVLHGRQRLAVTSGVAFIAALFLNSYVSRAVSTPIFWLPAISIAAAGVLYLARMDVRR